MRAYLAAIILISSLHIYFSVEQEKSPLDIPLLVLVLSPFLPKVWEEVSNIKIGKDGLELDRLKRDVAKTIERFAHGKSIDPSALDDLFKTVELNEWITLVLARMLMRKGLVSLAPNHQFGDSPSLSKLIPYCFEKGLISAGERDDLEALRDITFYAEWWGGRAPTYAQWNWALANGKSIVRSLLEKQPIG